MLTKSQVALASLLLVTAGLSACSNVKPQAPNTHPAQAPTMEKIAVPQVSDKSESLYQWRISTPEASIQPGKPISLHFTIQNQRTGLPVTTFNELHTKLAHLIIVSKDLKTFSHIHPEILSKGQMQVEALFPRAGNYFLFIQFRPDEAADQNLMHPLQIGNASLPSAQLVPDAQTPKQINGYTFRLTDYPTQVNQPTMLTLNIQKDGKPVTTIEPYLGAGGHTVLLSQDAQTFLHVHPMTEAVGRYYESPLKFHTQIGQPGLYKMWTQVQLQGKIETVDFSFAVKP